MIIVDIIIRGGEGGRKKWGKQDLVFCWYTQGFNGCRYVIQNYSELVMLFSSSSVFQFIFFFLCWGRTADPRGFSAAVIWAYLSSFSALDSTKWHTECSGKSLLEQQSVSFGIPDF